MSHTYGTTELWCKKRIRNDNDAKILIAGKNSETGIGKTTLAIKLARAIDPDWSAEEKGFISVEEYINAHKSKPPGSVLLLDEIEAGADSRRAMSAENVELSQAWATLRTRQIVTIATAPTVNMVDNRMLELADIWMLVKRRGLAQPYKIQVNDFNGKVARREFPKSEHIKFGDLPDNDPDKEYLDEIKEEMIGGEAAEFVTESECEKRVEKARSDARQELRDKIIADLRAHTDMSYQEIGELDGIELSRERIRQIVTNTS